MWRAFFFFFALLSRCICSIFISCLFLLNIIIFFCMVLICWANIVHCHVQYAPKTPFAIVTIKHQLEKFIVQMIQCNNNEAKKNWAFLIGWCAEIGHYIGICLLAELLIFFQMYFEHCHLLLLAMLFLFVCRVAAWLSTWFTFQNSIARCVWLFFANK